MRFRVYRLVFRIDVVRRLEGLLLLSWCQSFVRLVSDISFCERSAKITMNIY